MAGRGGGRRRGDPAPRGGGRAHDRGAHARRLPADAPGRRGDPPRDPPPRPIKLATLGVSGQGSAEAVTPIPPIEDPNVSQLEIAPIREGFSYVRISFHNVRNEHLYEVIEPPLSPIERELVERMRVTLVDRFQPLPELDPATKRREMRRMVDEQFQQWLLSPSPTTRGRIIYHLERDFIG